MKKIFAIAALAAATVFSVSCEKDNGSDITKKGINAHASLQPFEAAKEPGQNSHDMVWHDMDKISVLDNAGHKSSLTLTEGAGTASGTFLQEGSQALTAPLSAYYPASVVTDDKSLVWPATQADVKNITNVPMTASSLSAKGDVNFAFKHLGCVLQLVLTAKNGEINVKQIDVTADQGLSGSFTVMDGTAVISSTGTAITTGDISNQDIKLSASDTYLNFAVPAGEFTNFRIAVTDTNDKTYSLSLESLTLQRSMVSQVAFAMEAESPSFFELIVNGHTIRVKLSDDPDIEKDVWVNAYAEGNDAIVSAFSKSGKRLKCTMPDGTFSTSQSKTSDMVYTFTISGISENTTATIGYAKPVSIAISPAEAGSVKITGEVYEGETVTLEAISNYEYGFEAWLDKDGNPLPCEEEKYSDVRLPSGGMSVLFNKGNLILDGEFTVNASGKKVRFTRGNLYRDSAGCKIEQHQYDFNPSSYTTPTAHVSHFLWCVSLEESTKKIYSDRTIVSSSDVFFTEQKGFTVDGISTYHCHTLTKDEWSYLFGNSNARKGKYKLDVTVCGKTNCIVLLPDDWTGGKIEDSYDYAGWKRMEAAGAVCLPAAGYRTCDEGSDDPESVQDDNEYGYYWSTTLEDRFSVFNLYFGNSEISPDSHDSRSEAYAVRLVIESDQ